VGGGGGGGGAAVKPNDTLAPAPLAVSAMAATVGVGMDEEQARMCNDVV